MLHENWIKSKEGQSVLFQGLMFQFERRAKTKTCLENVWDFMESFGMKTCRPIEEKKERVTKEEKIIWLYYMDREVLS